MYLSLMTLPMFFRCFYKFCISKDREEYCDNYEEMLNSVNGLKTVNDSGNMLLVNEDPKEYFAKFKDRIGYIHLKDMRLATADDRRPDVSVSGVKMCAAYSGTGMVDFNRLIKAILASGYDGGMAIEFAYKDGMTFPDGLISARQYFEKLINGC